MRRARCVDTFIAMQSDLRTILGDWAYEPGKISVRKIIGGDGREKIQTRIDLGLLQYELLGRPDGERPHGCESLLEYQEQRLRAHVERCGEAGGFAIGSADCQMLRHEAHLYYQRFLALFVLEDYERVVQDVARNLRVLDLCREFGEAELDRHALEAQRAYFTMMHGRASASRALRRGRHDDALRIAEEAIAEVQRLGAGLDEMVDLETLPELRLLRELQEEILERMPSDAVPRLERALAAALADEDYETAADLRDRLRRAGRAAED